MKFYGLVDIRNKMKEKNRSILSISKETGIPNNTVYNVIKGNVDLDKVSVRVYREIIQALWK